MLESFFIYDSIPANAEKGEYQALLVALSYLVASFASFTALLLTRQMVNANVISQKRMYHWTGTFALGAGIWSMHFIGMLAYKMHMNVEYNLWLTLLSLLIAIAVAYFVLAIVGRNTLSILQ